MGQRWASAPRPLPDAAPIVRGALPEDLRLLLLGSLPADENGLEAMGFDRLVDHPQRPGHRYMEGYFHALPGFHAQAVCAVHPREAREHQRPPAPEPRAAFCEAFRRANSRLFSGLQRELTSSRGGGSAGLATVLQRSAHCADLSVQIHWGDEVPAEDISWHVDAANSFLHLAVGLHGARSLHAKRRVCGGKIHKICADISRRTTRCCSRRRAPSTWLHPPASRTPWPTRPRPGRTTSLLSSAACF